MFVLLQLKRSEDNIHESIQIKERLISELEHVEKQAANEQIWHQKIESELAHSDKLRHSEDMLASQMHRVTKRAPSRGRSSQQSATARPRSSAATGRRSASTSRPKPVQTRPARKPRPEPQPPAKAARRPQSANATRWVHRILLLI